MRHLLFRRVCVSLLSLILTIVPWLSFSTAAEASPTYLLHPPLMAIFSFSGTRPGNLGVQNGALVACPDSPNCVNSFSTDAEHKIDPIRFTSAPEKAFSDLKQTIQAMPRTQIVTENENYLYAEFASKLMGFVDDVEFYLDKTAGVIHARSASRLGQSDLGVNRQRIETIRAALAGNVASA